MTRGRPPYQALREARTIALRQGPICENTKGRGLLYDFAIHLMLLTVCVRIKRLRTHADTLEEVVSVSRREIAAIRKVPATAVLVRELWVRSGGGRWQYFLVLDDRITEILPGTRPEAMKDESPLRDNAPGPSRSLESGASPDQREKYYCPFRGPPE